jgi:predicted ABC-type ATPase
MTEKSGKSPYVFLFAGPNGSGKTSLIDRVKANGVNISTHNIPFPELIINPDQIAKEMPGTFTTQVERDLAAFRVVHQMRRDAMDSQKDFGFETVMSHPSRISEILRLKKLGYFLVLLFITTDDPDKNVRRVKSRFLNKSTTGHDVPEPTVRERYERTLRLLPKAIEEVDAALIFDNSEDGITYSQDNTPLVAPGKLA